ncbi:hypothetical protein AX17_002060 [Amanita inopinata Kibby_2008]|nr:hypothetical protein AX17_002060 [Amanita inopinata Kibby_2008]
MPPRKVVDSADAPAPRRSSRISSQAKEATLPKATATTGSNNVKKRAAAQRIGEEVGADSKAEPSKSKKKAKSNTGAKESEDKAEAEDSEDNQSEALASIDIGDSLPTLTLKNEKDEDVQVAELAVENGVVLFLVPKADTPGCTNQACGFRDIYQDFTASGYDVYCLSADTPAAQTKWQTKKELPYQLLSDRKRVLIGALGAADGAKTKRSHFIFEKGGKLVERKIPVKPNDSPKLALEFIKSQESD